MLVLICAMNKMAFFFKRRKISLSHRSQSTSRIHGKSALLESTRGQFVCTDNQEILKSCVVCKFDTIFFPVRFFGG